MSVNMMAASLRCSEGSVVMRPLVSYHRTPPVESSRAARGFPVASASGTAHADTVGGAWGMDIGYRPFLDTTAPLLVCNGGAARSGEVQDLISSETGLTRPAPEVGPGEVERIPEL